jgi:hypothetical protein
MKHGIFQESGKFKVYVNNELVYSARLQKNAENIFKRKTKSIKISAEAKENISKFHINQRFQFLNKTVKMVAKGLQPSAVISGSGGLGKSYSVRKALLESGLKDISSMVADAEEGQAINRNRGFVVVKGYSTAKGLFRTLFENNGSVIVFDDCDSVLKDPVALNLLKGALDSYDTRIISWNADMRDPDLPRSFIFTGRVIFISNIQEEKIDQAIRSRSAVIDVTMTLQEVVDRMTAMIDDPEFLPDFDRSIKLEALEFIDEFKTKMREVNLRSLITVCKVRAADEDGTWKDMAEYLTCK